MDLENTKHHRDIPFNLTRREWQVFQHAKYGMPGREIAFQLGIKPKTVKYHLGNVYKKCQVRNKYELQRLPEVIL